MAPGNPGINSVASRRGMLHRFSSESVAITAFAYRRDHVWHKFWRQSVQPAQRRDGAGIGAQCRHGAVFSSPMARWPVCRSDLWKRVSTMDGMPGGGQPAVCRPATRSIRPSRNPRTLTPSHMQGVFGGILEKFSRWVAQGDRGNGPESGGVVHTFAGFGLTELGFRRACPTCGAA